MGWSRSFLLQTTEDPEHQASKPLKRESSNTKPREEFIICVKKMAESETEQIKCI